MNGTVTPSQQTGTKLVDDFLRRELRVGDPTSATEVAEALRRTYTADAARIDEEGRGMALQFAPGAGPPSSVSVTGAETPGSREQRRVSANLESDLDALVNSPNNREWRPELIGWRETLTRELAEGAAAARFAQDPAMRQRGFYCVRKLSDFGRLARLASVVNVPLRREYRRLATTLDQAQTVVRVLMGAALYDGGLSEGGMILQVPLIDLRQRRDALVLAVRRLGAGQEIAEDGGDWGTALAAYRELVDDLTAQGATELCVYLREQQLATILDAMVSAASRQDPDSLRQMSSTLPTEMRRLGRLLTIAGDRADYLEVHHEGAAAAALSYLVEALKLFLHAFEAARGGARLIELAIPPSMSPGDAGDDDPAVRQAIGALVRWRRRLAREIDAFASGCLCDDDALATQVQLDGLLFLADTATDLLVQGTRSASDPGDEEKRSAALVSLVKEATFTGDISATDIQDQLDEEIFAIAVDDVLPSVQADVARAMLGWLDAVSSLAPRCSEVNIKKPHDNSEWDIPLALAGLRLLPAYEGDSVTRLREKLEVQASDPPLPPRIAVPAAISEVAGELANGFSAQELIDRLGTTLEPLNEGMKRRICDALDGTAREERDLRIKELLLELRERLGGAAAART